MPELQLEDIELIKGCLEKLIANRRKPMNIIDDEARKNVRNLVKVMEKLDSILDKAESEELKS